MFKILQNVSTDFHVGYTISTTMTRITEKFIQSFFQKLFERRSFLRNESQIQQILLISHPKNKVVFYI